MDLMFLVIVLCWRLTLINGACRGGDETLHNKAFEGLPTKTENTVGLQMCLNECTRRSKECKSINFHRQTLRCDLMSDEGTASDNLTQASGTLYTSRSSWLQDINDLCANASCPDYSLCVELRSGYYCAKLDCPAGTFRNGSVCQPCRAGYFSVAGRYSCSPCPRGTSNNLTGMTECKSCSKGSYQNISGQTTCELCPFGQYTDQINSVDCKLCPKGTMGNGTGLTQCHSCGKGSFQDSTGALNCILCANGTYQSVEGSTSCTPCLLGTFANSTGSLNCLTCPEGTYQNKSGQSECIPCPRGTYQDTTGATTCVACPADHYQDVTGESSCKMCTDNTQPWRKMPTADKKGCMGCYYGIGTYTDGDMGNIISTHSLNTAEACAMQCEGTSGCNGFTIRDTANTCYIHSTNSWAYGYTYRSVFYGRRC